MGEMERGTDFYKEFKKTFEDMCYGKGLNRKDAWRTLMMMFACTLSNAREPYEKRRQLREKEFEACTKALGLEKPVTLFALLIQALIENPAQDFLGTMYMQLSMGERGWGQVFTPYHVCDMMSSMMFDNPEEDIKEKGYITVSDPAVGGGAMLIAAVNTMRENGYDPLSQVIAVGQDIDITAVNMAYVQLSIIGCPAVLVRGDSLGNPYTGNPMFIDEDSEYWYTPALFEDVWNKRRQAIWDEYNRKKDEEKSA